MFIRSTVIADKLRGFTNLINLDSLVDVASAQKNGHIGFPLHPGPEKIDTFFDNKYIIDKTLKVILLRKNSPGSQIF